MVSRFHLGRLMATLAVAVMAMPAAAYALDLRSPDARDAAANAAPAVSTDLRTPDTKDAAGNVPLTFAAFSSDLRTADARDAASGRQVVSNPIVVTTPAAGDTFDWGDAAIGAGAMLLALALIAGGAGLIMTRRRRAAPAVTAGTRAEAVRHRGRVRPGTQARRHKTAR